LSASSASGSEVRERRTAYVLDASALLAFLQQEKGSEFVEQVLEHSLMSSVNWAEVLQRHRARGIPSGTLLSELMALGFGVIHFSAQDAALAADLFPSTRVLGLSLGDRACLALGISLGITVLTADRAWKELQLPVKVDVIR
jgi:PIN domain nuclease of toxin-antitoxin system